MAALTYFIAICLIAACVASSFVSFAAYGACQKKALAYYGVFTAAYSTEQMLILYNDYLTQNLPFNAEWGAMEDPLPHIVLGILLCQPIWLVALDFTNDCRKWLRFGPAGAFAVASIVLFLIPDMNDAVRKWILYTLRQFFFLGVGFYFWLRYLSTDTEVERARYSRKAPLVTVFTILVTLIILEDAVVMLFTNNPTFNNIFVTEFLYRRNVAEIVLSLCIAGYAMHDAIAALQLKRETPPSPEDSKKRQVREFLPYFAKRYELSPREEEILEYMIEGLDNRQIATELQVAIGTVKTHTSHIFKKTGVSNRAELFQKFWSEA